MSSRRDFFRKLVGKETKDAKEEIKEVAVVRPPYSIDESLFLSRCIECEDKACRASCEEEIIVIKADGTPTLNLTKRGCTFCDECAKACDKGVLSLKEGKGEWINAKFTIHIDSCMAHHGVICFACKEPCIDDAIIFEGMFNPIIDESRCTGCGFCMGRCPVMAISYEAIDINEEVESE